jgi:hypothetical protein
VQNPGGTEAGEVTLMSTNCNITSAESPIYSM